MSKLIVKRLHPDAIIPRKAHETDLGYDLFALEDTFLLPGQQQIVKTGISAQFVGGQPFVDWSSVRLGGYGSGLDPESLRPKFGLKIFDRSGMAAKNGVLTMAGVIDPSYDGPIGVVMILLGPGFHASASNVRVVGTENYMLPSGVHIEETPMRIKTVQGYQIKAGDRIAQMVPIQLHTGPVVEVEELPKGDRGDAGYGSSGR
jgi:dUTP pyrophosphatase